MLDKSRLTAMPLSTREQNEVAKFDQLANEWRKADGQFKHIHQFNTCRVNSIVDQLTRYFNIDINREKPLRGLAILDVGCGAGLICEALAELGADVTGIDASAVNIQVASQNAAAKRLNINYRQALAEQLLTDKSYDVVLNTEVIEHVDAQQALVETCAKLTRSRGLMIMATINRTLKSFLVAILGAEYVLRLLPRGTHDWRWFVSPEQIRAWLTPLGIKPYQTIGLSYNLLRKSWRVTSDSSVNYMLFASRV